MVALEAHVGVSAPFGEHAADRTGRVETRQIPILGHRGAGLFALVDAEDYELVAGSKWYLTNDGYARRNGIGRNPRGFTTRMHRLILGLAVGDPRQGDHINLKRLDNRRSNLRVGTLGENLQNVRSRRGSSSRYRGVFWKRDMGKWGAEVQRNFLGYFDTELDAARAAQEFRRRHMPFAVETEDVA